MPQFGEANEHASFPSWATLPIRQNIGRWPHPGTPRTDGRLVWPSDPLQRSLATRRWGQIRWAEAQPVGDPPEYPFWENVWYDWHASGPAEAFAWVSQTTSGRQALLRLRYYASLPITGEPGTELYAQYWKDKTSLGTRTVEYADSSHPVSFDTPLSQSGLGSSASSSPISDPLSPGEWIYIQDNATSECWRWWNTHRTTPCASEADPNGMASMAVEVEGWGWGDNKFTNFSTELTPIQRDFERKVNQRHILSPVWHPTNGWLPCWCQKQSEFTYDPIGEHFWLNAGLYYGYSLQINFQLDLIQVYLHVRVWSEDQGLPTWETWTSRAATTGIFFLLGMSGRGMIRNFFLAAPHASRSIGDLELSQSMVNVTPFGPFGLNDFEEPTISLQTLTAQERGQEPPLQGPLAMPRQGSRVFIPSDGSTPSISGGTYLPFGTPHEDLGDWYQPGVASDRVIVPDGIRYVRGCANSHVGNSANTHSMFVQNTTNNWTSYPYTRTKPDYSTDTLLNLSIPLLPVSPGDQIGVNSNGANKSYKNTTEFNWLYLEGIAANVESLSCPLIGASDAIPAAGTELWMATIPPSLNNYEITHVHATLGQNASPSTDLIIELGWIRATGRSHVDILTTPITIEATEWTSDTATNPPVIDTNQDHAETGDILIAAIAQSAAGATGLIIDVELTEP